MKYRITFKKTLSLLILNLLLLSAILLLMSSCEALFTSVEDNPPADNPFDPDNPGYVPPTTTIQSGPVEGETLNTDEVTFSWTGNKAECLFSFRLNQNDWSDWTQDTSATFDYLDEGDYTFEVHAKYPTDIIEASPASVNFSIDAIKGPALRFFRKKNEVNQGNTFFVNIFAEEVTNLAIVSVTVLFSPEFLQVEELSIYQDNSAFLKSTGGDIIQVNRIDNSAGKVEVYLSVAAENPVGVTGTGALFQITFSALQTGTTELSFDKTCDFRDTETNPIDIIDKVPGIIEIK